MGVGVGVRGMGPSPGGVAGGGGLEGGDSESTMSPPGQRAAASGSRDRRPSCAAE